MGIDDFHLGPGQNRLGPGEMVTRVDVPHPSPGTASAYRKFGKRGAGWDLAVSGVAVVVTLAGDGTVAAVRIALSSMAPTPMRAPTAEAYLAGRLPDEAALAEAARLAASEARPISDHRASAGYRRTLAAVLTRRTLTEVVAAAGGGR